MDVPEVESQKKNEHLCGIITCAYYTSRARDGHKNKDDTSHITIGRRGPAAPYPWSFHAFCFLNARPKGQPRDH